jgi:hypothetical protein
VLSIAINNVDPVEQHDIHPIELVRCGVGAPAFKVLKQTLRKNQHFARGAKGVPTNTLEKQFEDNNLDQLRHH